MSAAPVHVIGLGMPGDPLSTAARAALAQADLVIGANSALATLADLGAEKLSYPSPLSELWPLLERQRGKRIVLLTSGDPLFYGIGATLLEKMPAEQLIFHPNVTSIQAAFARLKRPWQQAQLLSLHGRPLNSLRSVLRNHCLYALLTDRASHPVAIARLLVELGFVESDLWVAEELGTCREQVHHFQAAALAQSDTEFAALNVVIIETQGPGGLLPEFPGIPDECFSTGAEPGKGLLSKREVRLMILSLLEPQAGEIGWDIGAGCGGVAVEWARWGSYSSVYAVECHPGRLKHLESNRERFGVGENLRIIAGYAPEALAELPDPQAVFVGGSGGQLGELLIAVWERLLPGGRLVTSAVTEDSRMALYQFVGSREAYWTELSVARGDSLAGQRLLRPQLPVLLLKLEKPRS
jgi:precorrin-6Y C5,15-methyltransferase (decarboxylating)